MLSRSVRFHHVPPAEAFTVTTQNGPVRFAVYCARPAAPLKVERRGVDDDTQKFEHGSRKEKTLCKERTKPSLVRRVMTSHMVRE